MIDSKEITVVFQGVVNKNIINEHENFSFFCARTKEVLPNAKIILSTWENALVPEDAPLDLIIRNDDPGPLAGIKFDDKVNNINRQIVTTQGGLNYVDTPYAIKLRTDSFLENSKFLDFYKKFSLADNRIITTSFFSIDPLVFEHMPFHVSDWFQFSKTEVLKKYWSLPLYSAEDASFYERNNHLQTAGYFDKKFRTKFAVEQYIAKSYAESLGYVVPSCHSDVSRDVISAHDKFFANELIVLDPWQAGLVFPKYFWAFRSQFQSYNCIMHLDWYMKYCDFSDSPVLDAQLYERAKVRLGEKRRVALGAKIVDPFGSFFYSKKMDRIATKLFKIIR